MLTPARAATASTDIRAYPRSASSARAASRIASSTRAERGRPGARTGATARAEELPVRIPFRDRLVFEGIDLADPVGEGNIADFEKRERSPSAVRVDPAISVVIVVGLANPAFLVEIEAVAVLPDL